MVQRGRESVVRFINHSDRENSVHLHGSYSRAPFDGWAEDTTLVGQYKDYCKCEEHHCCVLQLLSAGEDAIAMLSCFCFRCTIVVARVDSNRNKAC